MGVRRGNSSSSQTTELTELASRLHREHLFVDSEKRELQRLNEKVQRTVEHLQHTSWVWRHERAALDALVLGRGPSTSAAACCRRVNTLEGASFVDSYRALGAHDGAYAALLQGLRNDPRLVALSLVQGPTTSLQAAVDVLVASVYGCGSLPADEALLLQLLRELMQLQMEGCDNPRRLLQHGSCAFSRVYKAFTEGMPGAHLFLTSALRAPLIQVLVDDDLFLDIDPSKAVVRFPPEERLRHFGPRDSAEYPARLGSYRSWTLERLARLARGFVDGLQASWHWFPPALASLVGQLHTTLLRSSGGTEDGAARAGAVCSDLVFAFFVCPAVVSPELAGLVDAHVSHIARFNLMQVAQILQVLAMARWEKPDPRLSDLYDRFPVDCVSSLLDSLLAGGTSDPTSPARQLGELVRTGYLITEGELHTLVTFLRGVAWDGDCPQRKALESLLAALPTSPRKASNKGRRAEGEEGEGAAAGDVQCEEVLVIPVPDVSFECPGMLPEGKVLSMERQKKQTKVRVGAEGGCAETADVPETVEKRTRFSLSQDQESVGTSDNLEAASELASNHSVASSLELENDNYSDMVSANVSGRGTPNVSGRDTPSSQVGEEPPERPTRHNRSEQADIEDKFGRFEIAHAAPVQGDETKSIVSDTWSTDVLASDSEIVEQGAATRVQVLETSQLQPPPETIGDTGSDAWSTDVTASDTERLQDVDTDDTGSVAARSDDTRSEISAGGDEEPPPEPHGRSHRHHHHHHHHHHRRRSSLKPPPPSPKHPIGAAGDFSAFPLLVGTASPGSASCTGVGTDANALSPFQPNPEMQTSTPGAPASVTASAPVDPSLLDPLAVQVELRHPERCGTGEEDVTPTGTHATPSPCGEAARGAGASPTPPEDARGMQSLGRLSLAVRELPEEEAFLLLQGGEEDGTKSASPFQADDRAEDKRSKNFFRHKLSQLRFSFKPRQRKSNERVQNGPDTQRTPSHDLGSALEAADILEKYRGCGSGVPSSNANPADGEAGAGDPKSPGAEPKQGPSLAANHGGGEEALMESARRKLRQVLSLTELPPWGPQEPVALLRGLLAQATHLQQRALASHIHEALRCLALLDEQQCRRVIRSLREEQQLRAPYVAYLVRCRQGLLVTLSHLETLLQRTERDRSVCHAHLATLCARQFLDRQEYRLQSFLRHFQRLTVADEKAQEVERFLQSLFREMESDQTWQMASDLQMTLAQKMIERSIMSQIYVHALYPNGDGDVLRDQVLHQHIQKLSKVVTVDHRDLRIPRIYHGEAPWPSAQAELGALGAHKSPADKVACVASCCAAIMHLLSLAGGVPAADDLVPVLVFVLIRANPPHLLSTVQFVNTFHENRFRGEDAYWWTQFCSAVEFIKTMDY